MGVDTCVWRLRIGLYGHSCSGSSCSASQRHRTKKTSVVFGLINFLYVLCFLLLIGNVELNPGPTFRCVKCASVSKSIQFETLGAIALHQKNVHSNDSNFLFWCPMQTCSWQFRTYNALDVHISREHADKRHEVDKQIASSKCCVAGCSLEFVSNKKISSHLINDHIEHGTPVCCPLSSICGSEHKFSTANRFHAHMSRKHKSWTKQDQNPAVFIDSNDGSFSFEAHTSDFNYIHDAPETPVAPDFSDDMDEQQNDVSTQLNKMREEFYVSLGKFYMKLECKKHVPVSTIDSIAKELARLSEMHMAIVKKVISNALVTVNISQVDKERVLSDVLGADCMYAAHHVNCFGPTMTTNSRRKTFFRNQFCYVEPKPLNLSMDPTGDRNVFHVPIEETLTLVLKSPEIQKEIVDSFSYQSQPGLIQDYKDGSLHSNNNNTIEILLFQDAFNPLKDLSSVAKTHQILGIYWTIGNLKPFLRSKLNCIYLVQLIPNFPLMFEDFVKKCFEATYRDIKKLHKEGIEFLGERLRVRLQFVLGDNKGQHEIGGFTANFSGNYFCRFCPMSKQEINASPGKVSPLRTQISYDEAGSSINDGEHCTGVKSKKFSCIFNKLKDFHVCDPRLAPCIAHDILEGTIVYDLSSIIHHFVLEGWFTYKLLNKRIAKFDYGLQDSRNEPAPMKWTKNVPNKMGKVGGHAVQNWTLLRLLPFIIEDLIVNTNDAYFRLYLLLKEIIEYIFAPAITYAQLDELRNKLTTYADIRQRLMGNGKPKHHFMYHYPELFRIMGPLVHLFTLRFENFHQFFKRTAKMANNVINLGSTLVNKYCLYMSYIATGSPFCRGTVFLEDGISVASWLNSADEDLKIVLSTHLSPDSLIMEKIQYDEINLNVNEWLLLGNDEITVFLGKVQCIVVQQTMVYFLFKQHTANYVAEVGLYQVVSETYTWLYLSVQELKYPNQISLYEWNDTLCFSLKHILAHLPPQGHQEFR